MTFEHLTWSEENSVGNETLDSEHQYFVKLSNEIIDLANEDPQNTGQLMDKVDHLCNNIFLHFGKEELYLKEVSYPKLEEHKLEHQKHRKTIQDFMDKSYATQQLCMAKGDCSELTREIAEFVTDWVSNHMLGHGDAKKFFEQLGK